MMLTLSSQNIHFKCLSSYRQSYQAKKSEINNYIPTIIHQRQTYHSTIPKRLDEYKITELQPGLILIKNGLSPSDQIKLAEIALEFGSDKNEGFWKTDEQGEKVLNQAPSSPHRGRIFNALNHFPKIITDLCMDNLSRVAKVAKTIQLTEPTHLILLYYKTLQESPKGGYIPWHQDKDPNDGENELPVVSFTLGDSCDFLMSNNKPKISQAHPLSNPENLTHRILLESGDVLLFGGPSRYLHHSIHKIYQKSAPQFLPLQDARLNFTFRYAPKILGKEEEFSSKNFKSIYHSKKL